MMELFTLGDDYQPFELVERYSSLLWTERYSKTGDFQLTTTDIERMIALLPLESMVTIRESTVPMLVEVHKIEKGVNSAPILTVTGRSFESVLERRVAVDVGTDGWTGTKVPWKETGQRSSDAAYNVIRKIIGDELRTSEDGLKTLLPQTPIVSAKDALPMVDLTLPADYNDPDTTNDYEVKPGNLYTTAMELIANNHHGLKAVRPAPGYSKIGLEIYNGADLTDEVVIDAKFDQFENATYLMSNLGSTNVAYAFSKDSSQQVDKTTYTTDYPEPEGLKRKVIYVDASSEEGVNTPEILKTRALIELYKYNATALFDGTISQQIANNYNKSPGGYSLGDIIRLYGEYGLSSFVRVSEFIRSEDSTGSRAYPTFEGIDE